MCAFLSLIDTTTEILVQTREDGFFMWKNKRRFIRKYYKNVVAVVMMVLLVLGNIPFGVFANSDVQDWNYTTDGIEHNFVEPGDDYDSNKNDLNIETENDETEKTECDDEDIELSPPSEGIIAPPPSLFDITFFFPEALTDSNIIQVEVDSGFNPIEGVSALTETGQWVEVFLIYDGGLDIHAVYPNNHFTIIYGAVHPVTGEVFESVRNIVIVLNGLLHIAPLSIGGFTASIATTIPGFENTIDFTNAGHGNLVVPIFLSTNHVQVVNINAAFTDGSTDRSISIALADGLAFSDVSLPGMVQQGAGQEGHGGNLADNWTWSPIPNENISEALYAEITGASYVQNPIISRTIGEDYQPRAGTLTFYIEDHVNIDNLNLEITVVQDFAFAATVSGGGHHANAVTVTVMEDVGGGVDVVQSPAILEGYQVNGHVGFRVMRRQNAFTEVYEPGDTWRSLLWIDLNNVQSSPEMFVHTMLTESITFTVLVPQHLADPASLAVEVFTGTTTGGVNSNTVVGSSLTPANLVPLAVGTNVTVSTWNDFHYVEITLLQADFRNARLNLVGTVPTTTPPTDPQLVSNIDNTFHGETTPQNTGSGFFELIPIGRTVHQLASSRGSYGAHWIRVAEPFQNRLTVHPMNLPESFSGTAADSPVVPLGGFRLENSFAAPLSDQAIRITVPDESQNYIGIRAFRLPAGEDGIRNVTAVTTAGRTIHIAGPIGVDGIYHSLSFVNLSFYGATFAAHHGFTRLASNEFIVSLYYELYGEVPVGATYDRGYSWNNHQANLAFQYLGVVHQQLTAGTNVEVNAIAGLIDDTTDTGISNTLRTVATDIRTASTHATFTTSIGATNLGGLTLDSGQRHNNATFTIRDLPFQYRPLVFGVQGFYVYLRNHMGDVNWHMDSVVVNWGGNTYSLANGNLLFTTLIDSTGSTVYRLHLDEPILGLFDENMARYSFITIAVDLSVSAEAATQSILLRELMMVSTIREDIQIWSGGSAVNHHWNLGTDPGNFYIGDSRTMSGMQIGNPSNTAVVSIAGASNVLVGTALRYDATHPWRTYHWDFGGVRLDVDSNQYVEYGVFMTNNTGTQLHEFYTLTPIPRRGQWVVNQTAARAAGVQDVPFGFNMFVASDVNGNLPPGFRAYYADSYALQASDTVWQPWGVIAPEDILTVKIIAYVPVPFHSNEADNEYTFIINMQIDNGPFSIVNNQNVFASMARRNWDALIVHRATQPVGLSVPSDDPTITKTANRAVSNVGDVITYTITVTNPTDEILPGAFVVRDPISNLVTLNEASIQVHRGTTPVPFTHNFGADRILHVNLTNLQPGNTVITFTVDVRAEAAGQVIRNLAVLDIPGRPPGDNGSYVEIPVPIITKTANVTTAEVGDTILYTLRVYNPHDDALENILVTDNIFTNLVTLNTSTIRINGGAPLTPPAFTFGTPVNNIAVLSIPFASLASGVTNITFEVTVLHAAMHATVIPNHAYLYEVDPDDGTYRRLDEDDESIIVPGLLNPTLEKTANRNIVYVGDRITYTLTVTNPNDFELENWLLVDNLNTSYVAFVNGSVRFNGVVGHETASYHFNPTTGELRIAIPVLPIEGIIISFEVMVHTLPVGLVILNIAYLYGPSTSGGGSPDERPRVDEDTEEVPVRERPTDENEDEPEENEPPRPIPTPPPPSPTPSPPPESTPPPPSSSPPPAEEGENGNEPSPSPLPSPPPIEDNDNETDNSPPDNGVSDTSPSGTDPDVPPLPTTLGNTLVADGDIWIEFDDMGVPLGHWRFDPDEEIWIFDPAVPLGAFPAQTGLPQTGVNSNTGCLWLLLGFAGLIAVLAFFILRNERLAVKATKR